MDIIMVAFDTLIILLYITLIAFITPLIMKILKKRNLDIFFQLLPVLILTLLTSIIVAIGYGGFQETLFFQVTSILSAVLIGLTLFLIVAMRKIWHAQYEKLLERFLSLKTERIFSLK